MNRRLLSATVATAALAFFVPATAEAATAGTHTAGTVQHDPPCGDDSGHHGHDHGTISAQDATWLKQASASDLFEIRSSRLALHRSHRADVRAFAEHLIMDHTMAYQAKAKLAATYGVSIARHPAPALLKQLAALKARHGASFDMLYLTAQVAGHTMAVAGTAMEVQKGRDASVRAEAKKELPVISGHLVTAKKLLAGSSGHH